MTLRIELGFDRQFPIVSGNNLIFGGTIWEDEALSVPRNLSGVASIVAGLFAQSDPSVAVATIDLDDGVTILNAALGTVRYRFPKAATKDRSGIYLIQVDVTDGDGNLSTASKGRLRLEDGLLD